MDGRKEEKELTKKQRKKSSPGVMSHIHKSANSNVTVYIDNVSLAYALLCCFYATNRVSDEEFESMVTRLNSLLAKGNMKELLLGNHRDVIEAPLQ